MVFRGEGFVTFRNSEGFGDMQGGRLYLMSADSTPSLVNKRGQYTFPWQAWWIVTGV